ncbi:hypothetical protein [Pseudomonas nitroreducens]|uniref:hypothetical protein n=1 Tax=Pseudomonas nitroreducens TaxID=46680 RepID=UPI00265A0D64|nr:hypothetical protein [Pseudomonas nitroreducens]MCP1651702.1 hypothetical protein [Pseudomonas nitroreducens]MCP1684433.1 hypothetical protein [Pseudomonas nitroreducens]
MPIDPSSVQWDTAPLDAGSVQWDDQPAQKPAAPMNKSGISNEMQLLMDINSGIQGAAGNIGAGALRGAGSIGATLLAPYDMAKDAIAGKGLSLESNRERRAGIDSGLRELGANPDSAAYKVGKLGGEIAGTAGAGPLIAGGARAVPVLNTVGAPLISAVESGGFAAGGLTGLPALATRVAGGAITGGASAGLVNPEDAGLGAVVGGAIPGVASVVGSGARALGSALRGGEVAPEVAQLAQKAQQLGIDVPADRIVNSKPMNALASSLEYLPLSGRTATMANMQNQLNRAVTRTFGQDSDNVTMALRKAKGDLGAKFDDVLKNNAVKVDGQFMDDLTTAAQQAKNELETGQANVILNQIDEIMKKAPGDVIDGQAAYNVKKTLDRIGSRNSPEAWYANELKRSLMGALNRSMPEGEAAAFAKVRQQYGTMLDLQKLAQNGADGDISIARLANMKNIGNPELQDLADISAQFLKAREGQHGAAQRIVLGTLGAAGAGTGAVSPLLIGGGMLAGRGANKALNSQALRNVLLSPPSQGGGLLTPIGKTSSKVLPLLVPSLSAQ